MTVSRPDINYIKAEDLSNDTRLKELYIEAIRQGHWPNSASAMLEFAALAEKALQDDKHGTPGKLFHSLIKRKDSSMVTQAAENRASARFPSHIRQTIVEEAAALKKYVAVKDGDVQDALIDQDTGYGHAVMMQCFLPQRPIPDREYETFHGRASLLIEAGQIANPNQPRQWIKCDVPSGPKPRLILPYIIGEAIRSNSPEIDLGQSLRKFMSRLRMPITGHNGKALTAQIQNVAAAHILIGEWADDAVHTHGGRLAKRLSFWLEREPNQRSFWTPTMTLSDEFFEAIQQHRVPIDTSHLARFARSPRRMDLYAWLSYRTPRIPHGKRQPVSLQALWSIFAPYLARFADFKNRVKGDLNAIADVYPHFNADIDDKTDILWLRRSRPPVPFTPRFPGFRCTSPDST